MPGRFVLSLAGLALAGAAMGACALRLGGSAPETFRVLTTTARGAPDAAALGNWMRALEPDLVLVAADADSAWFAAVAGAAGHVLSGPALPDPADRRRRGRRRAEPAVAVLAWEAVGDTTLLLTSDGGASIRVHDALYRTGRDRLLDLMIVVVPAGADPRDVTRALLTYIASEVMHEASVLLALRAADAAAADSLQSLLRPAFAGAAQCDETLNVAAAAAPGALRIYFGPAVRVRCEAVRGFDAPWPTLLARVTLGE